ncbi:unnamed protein product [Phytophthora lilii]|uniref:Unnamed protein product n=1 Tax=Phytophthora lilii TaxID=2077276 RepID=A0A9W6UCR9_9STRA|nr:unnamed protein product [Phytophthora lilii]
MSETQLSDQYLYQSSLKSDPEIKVSSSKRTPFVIDLNQGSYQNGVITIDATAQLSGSEGFASLRDAYIMLPYKVSIPQYVEKHGAESFLFPDAGQSVLYSAAAATAGDAYSNNTAFTSSLGVQAQGGATVPNDGFVKRLLSNPPTSGADSLPVGLRLVVLLLLLPHSNQTARGAFVAGASTANAIMGTWNYMLKVKLTDLHPIFRELDLMANPQIRLRFRVNQGTAVVAVEASKNMSLTS